jgi:hypothetical protein
LAAGKRHISGRKARSIDRRYYRYRFSGSSSDKLNVRVPVIQPTLSGTVFERTAQGVRPVPDIKLTGDFSAGLGWGPSATTVTDANGRYLLCGVDGVLG